MNSHNPLVNTLENSQAPLVGASSLTQAPEILDVYGDLGLDFVWLDHEHIGPSTDNASHFQRIRKFTTAAGIEPIVRVSSPTDPAVGKVLDAGIRSVVLPEVDSPEQLRETLRCCYYEYDGTSGARGLGTSFANNWGNYPDEYTEREDAAVIVGIMIETERALESLDELFAVPEVGFAQVGPTDLSASLGVPLERDNPAVQEAILDVLEAGDRHNVPIGASAGYVGGVEAAIDQGFQLIKLGNDVSPIREVYGQHMDPVTNLE
jgi:2-dehydro-3-deoxyglucarate aldolase